MQLYWQQIDPTDPDGQFNDRGSSYKTAIFYHTENQKALTEMSKKELENSNKFKKPIVTEIKPATVFYPAEEKHQKYHKKNPFHYNLYKEGSDRNSFIRENWRDGYGEVINKITPLQYNVTQKNATEPAFNNEFWENKEDGIYVDIISGEPLYSGMSTLN